MTKSTNATRANGLFHELVTEPVEHRRARLSDALVAELWPLLANGASKRARKAGLANSEDVLGAALVAISRELAALVKSPDRGQLIENPTGWLIRVARGGTSLYLNGASARQVAGTTGDHRRRQRIVARADELTQELGHVPTVEHVAETMNAEALESRVNPVKQGAFVTTEDVETALNGDRHATVSLDIDATTEPVAYAAFAKAASEPSFEEETVDELDMAVVIERTIADLEAFDNPLVGIAARIHFTKLLETHVAPTVDELAATLNVSSWTVRKLHGVLDYVARQVFAGAGYLETTDAEELLDEGLWRFAMTPQATAPATAQTTEARTVTPISPADHQTEPAGLFDLDAVETVEPAKRVRTKQAAASPEPSFVTLFDLEPEQANISELVELLIEQHESEVADAVAAAVDQVFGPVHDQFAEILDDRSSAVLPEPTQNQFWRVA
ncbi:hypothetical protein [Leifsonia sp. Leaf264]|uniref:hypothetical protein n=1 Tax=Leifsonia sp. Leaf264 TaxID=1736314 RepID=UPI000700D1F5|nr:hypothetical protein [Leifsonia sp. Leaf264]KQP01432.1 hypothetical protein ASF30_02100 [Leifsonia sp. Leaf264]